MEGRLYLRLLRRHLGLIVAVLVLSIAVGAWLYALAAASFRGTLTFVVQSNPGSDVPSEVYQAELLSQARAQTYSSLVASQDVVTRLLPQLPGGVTDVRVRHDLSATAAQGSVLLSISVTDRSRTVVRGILGGLVDQFPAYVTEQQGFETTPITSVNLASHPGPVERVGPTRTRYFGLAVLAGLLLGFLAAILREMSNRRVRDLEDVRSAIGTRAVVIDFPVRSRRRSQLERAPVQLSKLVVVAGMRRRPIMVVSTTPGKRAASHIVALGRRLATAEHRVVLVDFDVEGAFLSRMAEATRLPVIVRGLEDSERRLARGDAPGLQVVPAEVVRKQLLSAAHKGPPTDPAASVLANLNEGLRPAADTVLVVVGDVLLRAHPGVRPDEPLDAIVLAERGRTTKEALSMTVEVLGQLGAYVGAVVLVHAAPRRDG